MLFHSTWKNICRVSLFGLSRKWSFPLWRKADGGTELFLAEVLSWIIVGVEPFHRQATKAALESPLFVRVPPNSQMPMRVCDHLRCGGCPLWGNGVHFWRRGLPLGCQETDNTTLRWFFATLNFLKKCAPLYWGRGGILTFASGEWWGGTAPLQANFSFFLFFSNFDSRMGDWLWRNPKRWSWSPRLSLRQRRYGRRRRCSGAVWFVDIGQLWSTFSSRSGVSCIIISSCVGLGWTRWGRGGGSVSDE